MNPIEYFTTLWGLKHEFYPIYYWEVWIWELIMAIGLVSGVFSYLFIMKHGRKLVKEEEK